MKQYLLVFIMFVSLQAQADSFFAEPECNSFYSGVGLQIVQSRIDTIDRREEDDKGWNPGTRVFAGFAVTPNVALELGAFWFDELRYEGQDATGQYELTFERYDIYLGPVVQFKPRRFIPIRLMAAVTRSHITMEVKESFWGLSPSGKVTEKDSVTGAHVSVGVLPFQRRRYSGVVSIDYIYRPDFFDNSSRPFTSEEIGIGFRMAFH